MFVLLAAAAKSENRKSYLLVDCSRAHTCTSTSRRVKWMFAAATHSSSNWKGTAFNGFASFPQFSRLLARRAR